MSKSLVVSWLQTSRYVQITDTVYEETLKNIMAGGVNDVAKSFSYLSIADQNKIMADQHEAKWYNDIFYGEILDERQTDPSNYDTLTPELDVLDNQTVYGYVTRAEGIRTLLAKESQVIDFAGGSFDLDVLFPRLYEVYRNRKETGDNVDCINLLTDKDSAAMLRAAFRAIQKAFYGITDTTMYSPGKVLEGTRTAFQYEKYQLPGVPYDIAVFVLENFTDRIAAFGDGTGGVNGAVNLKNSARMVMALDWSDIEIPISGTATARRELNGANAANVLASLGYVIKLNPKKIDLRSVTHSVFIGDESRHLILENYALEAPTYTLPGYAAPVYS